LPSFYLLPQLGMKNRSESETSLETQLKNAQGSNYPMCMSSKQKAALPTTSTARYKASVEQRAPFIGQAGHPFRREVDVMDQSRSRISGSTKH